jgi:hypothetical protein
MLEKKKNKGSKKSLENFFKQVSVFSEILQKRFNSLILVSKDKLYDHLKINVFEIHKDMMVKRIKINKKTFKKILVEFDNLVSSKIFINAL